MKTIYYNGDIITVNDKNMFAQALCEENGKITAVGSNEEILSIKKDGDKLIDLKGKTMLPAFIDAHSHFTGYAHALEQCDLSNCKNFEDIINTMSNFINKNKFPSDKWIIGCNYDQNFLKEQKHPDRHTLDKISDTKPILIIHASSHMGVANSKALEIQKIDENTKDFSNGRYAREENSLVPNGYMEEKAFLDFQSKIPTPSVENLLNLINKAQNDYASYGIATVQEGMVAKPLFELLKYASSSKVLKIDVIGFADIATASDLFDKEPLYANKYHNHFKLGGYKIFLDGSPQGKTAWMSKPYENEKDYCGYPIYEDDELLKYIKLALNKKQQLLAHCNGDQAAEQYISQFEKALAEEKKSDCNRAVMIHAQLVRKDQLKRMAKIGMMASFFVAHTYYWGDIHLKNFGQKRGSQISPVKDALDLGVKFTFHQDSPVVPPDMLKTISCAVNRVSKSGKTIGENQKTDVLNAIKAVTINAAYQYFEENEKGSIEVGKNADFVILDNNPLSVDKNKIEKINVLETIKDGKVIFKSK